MMADIDPELEKAFRSVFATNEGKRVLFWMIERAGIYRDAFTGDNNATNYGLGLQSGGRALIGMLDLIEPRFYPQLLLAIADLKAVDRAAEKAKSDNLENDDNEDAP